MFLRIRYNGRRFPRIINMSGRQGALSFTDDVKELLVSNYDANLLLTFNTRLNTSVWEFDVIDAIKDNEPIKAIPQAEKPDIDTVEKPDIEKKEEIKSVITKKPAKRGRKKGA